MTDIFVKVRPLGTAPKPMGIVKDTDHVREIEQRYKMPLVGYTASWDSRFRTQVLDNAINQWRGVYPLTAEDLQLFTTNRKKES